MRFLIFMLSLCAALCPAFAADSQVVEFTLERLFSEIDSRSTPVRVASLMADEAQEGVAEARSARLPDIGVKWQVGYLGDGYVTDRNFSNGMKVDNPHFVNNFSIEAMQVVYSGGALTQGIRMAELQSRLAELSVEESRRSVQFLMLSRLIDLQCLNKQHEVLTQSIELAQSVLDQMEARLDQGVILENDLTRYRLQTSDLELQRDRIEESLATINDAIATALDYPSGTRFALNLAPVDDAYELPSAESWMAQAMQTNTTLNQARTAIDFSRAREKMSWADRMPHVGLFAYGNFNSPVTIEVPVLNNNFMYWGFGLNVSYSISSLYKSNKATARARIGIVESQERLEVARQDVFDRVTQACEAFNTARSELRTRRYALQLADQNYETISCRFNEGMALVTDLVDAANLRVAARTGLENAESRLLFCLYKLKFIANTL